MTTPDHDTAALTEADRWNADWPVGTPVYAWPGVRRDKTPPIVTATRSPAWTIAGDQHIVSVEGYPGGIALTHVQVRPAPQPTPICRHGFFDSEAGHWCDEQQDRKRAMVAVLRPLLGAHADVTANHLIASGIVADPAPRPECVLCGDPLVWDAGNGGQWLGIHPPRDWMTCHGRPNGPLHVAPGSRQGTSVFVNISKTLDAQQPDHVSEGEHLWRRVTKVCEESGEVWRALSGLVGENPRKGQTHTRDDLLGELLDTAAAALCGWAHVQNNRVDPLPALLAHVDATAARLDAALQVKP